MSVADNESIQTSNWVHNQNQELKDTGHMENTLYDYTGREMEKHFTSEDFGDKGRNIGANYRKKRGVYPTLYHPLYLRLSPYCAHIFFDWCLENSKYAEGT